MFHSVKKPRQVVEVNVWMSAATRATFGQRDGRADRHRWRS